MLATSCVDLLRLLFPSTATYLGFGSVAFVVWQIPGTCMSSLCMVSPPIVDSPFVSPCFVLSQRDPPPYVVSQNVSSAQCRSAKGFTAVFPSFVVPQRVSTRPLSFRTGCLPATGRRLAQGVSLTRCRSAEGISPPFVFPHRVSLPFAASHMAYPRFLSFRKRSPAPMSARRLSHRPLSFRRGSVFPPFVVLQSVVFPALCRLRRCANIIIYIYIYP